MMCSVQKNLHFQVKLNHFKVKLNHASLAVSERHLEDIEKHANSDAEVCIRVRLENQDLAREVEPHLFLRLMMKSQAPLLAS